MVVRSGNIDVGPDNGTLRVRTYREGIAQKLGHDLIIDVARWKATVEVSADGSPETVVLDADASSLRVLEGNGLKPLTDKDRADIVKNIDEQILRGTDIAFRSRAVEREDSRLRVSGDLTLAATTRPASFELAMSADGRITGTLPVVQSEWGIVPFSAPGGVLRLRDTIEVVLDVVLASD